ncbi:cell division protein ZapA [Perlucidibaca aquatica]|jgi:cell division protein ZapA|uniref:cell division protein ZapA n=1 Tax=Perlucidibaca aquatica TaxID=1852776 RepID=UPI000839EEB1|nr:cell division protein ZapA [Perlucidibaca aquatica]
MNPEVSTLDVFILDKAYKIASPLAEQDNLRRAAQYLDRKMREIRGSGKVLGLERIAVIAALNIAHELLSLRQQTSGEAVSPADIALLLQRMEAGLAETSETEIR